MSYALSGGVRRGETDLPERINAVLRVEPAAVGRLLRQYGLPAAHAAAGPLPLQSLSAVR